MKKLIIILLSIPFFILSAFESDPLDLGNVIIQGEIETLEDTLNSAKNLDEYCLLTTIEKFEYSAYYSPIIIDPAVTYPVQKSTALLLKGGMENFAGIQGIISFSNIWNFSADLLHHQRSKDWKEDIYSLQWQPEINEHKMILDFSNKEFSETKISGGYVSYVKKDLVISQIHKISFDINFKSAFNEFKQLQATATNFDVNSKIGIKYYIYNGNISVNLLKQKVSGYFDAGITGLKFFDEIGLWCAYDEDEVYPSIHFNSKISLYNNLRIRFENNPTISSLSCTDGFNENLLQDLFPGDSQTKKILNSFIILESDFVLPISIYHNASIERDHLLYYDDVADSNGFYKQENIDCLIHKVGLKAAYKHGDFTLIQNMEYKISDEDLYFEPLLVTSTKLEMNKNHYYITIDLQLLSGGVDDIDEELKNAFLADMSASYRLSDKLSILAEARNLFDQQYKKYTNYTADGLQLLFGVKMTF